MSRLKDRYAKEVAPALKKEFGYRNVMAIPKIEKVVVNMGLGEATSNANLADVGADELGRITGQKAVVRRQGTRHERVGCDERADRRRGAEAPAVDGDAVPYQPVGSRQQVEDYEWPRLRRSPSKRSHRSTRSVSAIAASCAAGRVRSCGSSTCAGCASGSWRLKATSRA